MEPQIIFRVRLAPPLAPCATNAAPANPEMIFVSPADTRFGGLSYEATNRLLAESSRLRLRLVFAVYNSDPENKTMLAVFGEQPALSSALKA